MNQEFFNSTIPIKVESNSREILYTYYDKKSKDKNAKRVKFAFDNYFYIAEKNEYIIKKTDTRKVSTKSIYRAKQELTEPYIEKGYSLYESDFSAEKRFYIDMFSHRKEIEECPLHIGFIDIENIYDETKGISIEGKFPITLITVYDNYDEKLYTYGWHKNYQCMDTINNIYMYSNEKDMLEAFLSFWELRNFSIVTGWNIDGYDIPYLHNRLMRFNLQNRLSPFEKVDYWNEEYIIKGISIIDYMKLFKKFHMKSMQSYSLNNVSKIVLEKTKTEYEEENLNELYKSNIEKYIEYNRNDVLLNVEIDKKLTYINLADEIRRIATVNFEDIFFNSKVIDSFIIRLLTQRGLVSRGKQEKSNNLLDAGVEIAGAYVKEPIPGIYNYVIDNDFTQLYPSIINNLNISPETKQENGDLIASNGCRFSSKEEGIFPFALKWLFNERMKYKDLMKKAIKEKNEIERSTYNSKQNAVKSIMVSMYGFMVFQGSRFFDKDLGEAITLTGQKLIKHVIRFAERKGYRVITVDTDSILFTHDDGFKNDIEAREVGLKLASEINDDLQGFAKRTFNIENSTFDIKQEIVARKGIFFGKKHYVLKQTNSEGLEVNEFNFKGVQIVRNDTCNYAKKYLKQIYDVILSNDDFTLTENLVKEFSEGLNTASLDSIGIPISFKKEYKKEPIQARGVRYWEWKFASETKKSFETINRGIMFFLKSGTYEKEYIFKLLKKDIYNEDHDEIICIPIGTKVPESIVPFIDYDRMRERIINLVTEEILFIIDCEKIKKDIIWNNDEDALKDYLYTNYIKKYRGIIVNLKPNKFMAGREYNYLTGNKIPDRIIEKCLNVYRYFVYDIEDVSLLEYLDKKFITVLELF